MSEQRIGVVLSSGGGQGIFGHTGFMAALDSLGIKTSAIAGCSAGAVVGGVLASGTKLERWIEAIRSVRPEQYWRPRSSLRFLYSIGCNKGRRLLGLSDTRAAIRFLSTVTSVDRIEDCACPFVAVALNLGTCEKEFLDTGPLADTIMASAAISGLYDPVKIEGNYYTDGATIDLSPTDAICCRHHLDVLLVHHLSQSRFSTEELEEYFDQPWPMVRILRRLIFRRHPWYATGHPCAVFPCACGCPAINVVIEPNLPEVSWPVTKEAFDLIESARTNAISQLSPLMDTLTKDPRALLG